MEVWERGGWKGGWKGGAGVIGGDEVGAGVNLQVEYQSGLFYPRTV